MRMHVKEGAGEGEAAGGDSEDRLEARIGRLG
jgi:hypothetical protein